MIDEKERTQILAWAKENQDDKALSRAMAKEADESYFRVRTDEEGCIMKYYFSTAREIEERMCETISGIDPEIIKAVNIAVLKNKPQTEKITDEIIKQDKIPECIYVF
ncbi:MAG: hypothetical protein K2O65_09315 [Lachnospiraceae bacterium]|nr:hypothetical protein [Lachnospiraceae bacterium]